jgi:hypothetical protein
MDRKDYFFSGVLATGGAIGVAFTLAFLSSIFLSSTFFSSFTGLAVGLGTVDGLEVAAGEAATTGVEVGVVVTGFTVAAGSPQALPIAATAAKTISRIDLLIVFSFVYRSQSVLSETAAIDLMAVPASFDFTAGYKKKTGLMHYKCV